MWVYYEEIQDVSTQPRSHNVSIMSPTCFPVLPGSNNRQVNTHSELEWSPFVSLPSRRCVYEPRILHAYLKSPIENI